MSLIGEGYGIDGLNVAETPVLIVHIPATTFAENFNHPTISFPCPPSSDNTPNKMFRKYVLTLFAPCTMTAVTASSVYRIAIAEQQ